MAFKFSTGLRDSMLTGSGLSALMNGGSIMWYTGAQPASPDDAPTGTLLATFTIPTTGLNFEAAAVAGTLSKAAAENWTAVAAASGTPGYFRMVSATDTGVLSTTEPRIDGSIGTFGADMNVSNINVVAGATETIDAFSITLA